MNNASQIRHPWRATVRTFVAYVVAALVALNAALPVIEDTMGIMLTEHSRIILSTIVSVVGALTACVTRIMALKPVNDFLALIGLDADPDVGIQSDHTD